jgi:signal transduction histidine kinase
VAIANLVKEDQQQAITEAFLLVTGPVIIVSASIGYFVARYLLRPVRESYQSQERFLQDAAHEMRNPLAAISLATENARAKSITPSEFLQTVSRQNNRLVQINEDLLYLERKRSESKPPQTNVSELLEDVLEDFQPSIAKKQLHIKRQIEPKIVIAMQAEDFVKITKNLIDNAIKYTPKDKAITVTLSRDKQILFAVKDQGIGIDKEELSHIGERFYRAKNASGIDGTGLGIAIVQKILKSYNGQLKIKSTKGKGTSVEIRM